VRAFCCPPPAGEWWTFFTSEDNLAFKARYPSGKGEVCKTFIREFDSHPRLQDFVLYFKLHNLPSLKIALRLC
jgi:hypothetical protein